ncbi:phospholipase A1 2-like [Galleria mellonella]|uniref:Phospholipase A1 2-like n=1 Tax=Galleria mellonella TaxID=7137 RepID=A0A6J1WA08_GALME|nr:phospholipase A1 2-like [Galleria mellonella]
MLTTIAFLAMLVTSARAAYTPHPEIGYPLGYLPECPGSFKNASISPKMLQYLQVVLHQWSNNGAIRHRMPVSNAAKMVKIYNLDLKNKKTVIYLVGFLDASAFLHTVAVASSYAKRGYNVFVSETIAFLSHVYPKSVRLARPIGNKIGEFLVNLTAMGMKPENLELVGLSLGCHVASFASKYYYAATGKKPSRITALDPAGPCFRTATPNNRLDASDAERVDVLHTNIDGFGIAERLGHIDIYINGGEFQPGDIPAVPCLVLCSHVKSTLYWWQALENPKKFIAVKCDNVQDARSANCYKNSDIIYVGLNTDFDKPGVYYLSTTAEYPYYRGKDGLTGENEVFTNILRKMNSDDNFDV